MPFLELSLRVRAEEEQRAENHHQGHGLRNDAGPHQLLAEIGVATAHHVEQPHAQYDRDGCERDDGDDTSDVHFDLSAR